MAQEALSDAVSAPFRPNVSSYAEGEPGDRQGDAARMFKRREKSHPSEETTPAFKTLSIFTGELFSHNQLVRRRMLIDAFYLVTSGEDERFAYVSNRVIRISSKATRAHTMNTLETSGFPSH